MASSLSSSETKLLVHFVELALCPLTRFEFNVVFQTTKSKKSTMQRDILDLLRSYISNFIKGSVLCSNDDLTTIAYDVIENQLSKEELRVLQL